MREGPGGSEGAEGVRGRECGREGGSHHTIPKQKKTWTHRHKNTGADVWSVVQGAGVFGSRQIPSRLGLLLCCSQRALKAPDAPSQNIVSLTSIEFCTTVQLENPKRLAIETYCTTIKLLSL